MLNPQKVRNENGALGMSQTEVAAARNLMVKRGAPVSNLTDDQIRELIHQQAVEFRDNAPTSAAQAANTILEGVKSDKWRILVGEDAQLLDAFVREAPEDAYEEDFLEKLSDNSVMDRITRGNND